MNLRETYNRIAKDWHKDHQADDWWVEGTDKFASLFNPGAEILDVGCGGGVKAKYLTNKGLRVTGIDFSDELIAIAKQEVPDATFQVLDMRESQHLQQQFDGVFAQASLLHIPKQEIGAVMEGLAARLKQGGHFYVAVKKVRPGNADEEVKEENDYGYSYKRFFSYFTPEELRSHFQTIGFKVIYENVRTAGQTDWLQVIGKKA